MTRIAFRVDASQWIGYGHVARCLVLADALAKRGAEIRFFCRPLPERLLDRIKAHGFTPETLLLEPSVAAGRNATATDARRGDSWKEDLAATQRAVSAWGDVDWLVVDHYDLDAEWERPLRGTARRVMVIDDLANRPHDCDLLVDHNCGAEQGHRYDALMNWGCQTLLGPEYALLPPAFDLATKRSRDRDGAVRRVLISFGGADPSDETTKAICAIGSIGRPELEVDVAVGGYNLRWDAISALSATHPNVHCHRDLSDMAGLFASADLAFGGGGLSLLERCAFSLPAIIESLAPNQEQGCRALAQRGGALYLGDAAQVAPEQLGIALTTLLVCPDLVRHLSEQAGKVVDCRGVERVVRAIVAEPLALRTATAADCDTMWHWRNDTITRKFANDPSEITLDVHRKWLSAVLDDADRHLLVANDNSGEVGVVRYDIAGDTATISVFLDPRRHGQGLGPRLIAAGDARLKAMRPSIRKVTAEINSENIASLRAFLRAGYVTESHRLARELPGIEQ